MKTLDKNYLATHPSGDEKADITLSASVPVRLQLAANADGTRPQVSIRVTSDTYMNVLATLDGLHDDAEPLLAALMLELLTEEELGRFATLAEAGPLIKERFAEVVVPFRTFNVSMDLDGEPVDFAITAPSAEIGAQALHHLTKPNMLTNTAIAMCPETDDEDDDEYGSNEVLVIG